VGRSQSPAVTLISSRNGEAAVSGVILLESFYHGKTFYYVAM
jgi:hypothetical protein